MGGALGRPIAPAAAKVAATGTAKAVGSAAAAIGRGLAKAGSGVGTALGKPLRQFEPRISHFVHETMEKSILHQPLTRFGQWLKLNVCFVAGTPLLTPDGCKLIEQFRPGDVLWSRHEDDPEGMIEAKVVEEVFRGIGQILYLTVGGQRIGTSSEHPFWVRGKGWLAAEQVIVGDHLLSHDGRYAVVTGKENTGEWAVVYNVRVADYHTYFVGASDWGFSAWAHNMCQPRDVTKAVKQAAPKATFAGKTTAKRVADALNANNKSLAVKILKEDVKGIGPKKAEQIADSLLVQMRQNPRTYQTYIKTHTDGSVYIGRASGRGTPQENIARREAGGHDWTKRGYGEGVLDQTSESYAAIRGREQMLKDHYDRLGINAEIDGGISPRNASRQFYLDEARRLFGEP